MEGKKISQNDTITGAVVLAFIGILILHFFHISIPLSIISSTRSSELAVVGEGKVEVVPDSAVVEVGVEVSNASTAQDAQSKITAVNNAIIQAVQKLGVQKDHITTTNFSINPDFETIPGQTRNSGFRGNATLSIKTKDTQLIAQIIDEATKAGANQVNQARFTVDNPNELRVKARDLAISNAREQAKKLTAQLGIKLGKVTNIVESSSGGGDPISLMKTAVADSASLPEIAPGTQTISSTVTLYFEKN